MSKGDAKAKQDLDYQHDAFPRDQRDARNNDLWIRDQAPDRTDHRDPLDLRVRPDEEACLPRVDQAAQLSLDRGTGLKEGGRDLLLSPAETLSGQRD